LNTDVYYLQTFDYDFETNYYPPNGIWYKWIFDYTIGSKTAVHYYS